MKKQIKALSVRAPWWWFILHAGKDIENRDWPTSFRGTVYLHASKWYSGEGIKDDWNYAMDAIKPNLGDSCMTLRKFKELGGHLVGTVEIVDCVTKSDSPWFQGKYGFVLANPKPLETPIPCKGALGFFDVGQALNSVGRDPVESQSKPLLHSEEGRVVPVTIEEEK